MSDVSRIAAAAAGALLLPLALVGCTPTSAQTAEQISAIVTAAHPDITSAYVSAADGLSGASIWVRVYVAPDAESISSIVDASLAAIVNDSPRRLTAVTIDVSDSPRPSETKRRVGALNLDEANEELGFNDYYFDRAFTLTSSDLVERYGEWKEPSE